METTGEDVSAYIRQFEAKLQEALHRDGPLALPNEVATARVAAALAEDDVDLRAMKLRWALQDAFSEGFVRGLKAIEAARSCSPSV